MLFAEIGGKQLLPFLFRRGGKELLKTLTHFPRYVADKAMSVGA
jgi:hypothetical protein